MTAPTPSAAAINAAQIAYIDSGDFEAALAAAYAVDMPTERERIATAIEACLTDPTLPVEEQPSDFAVAYASAARIARADPGTDT